jgi:hypothetical protein
MAAKPKLVGVPQANRDSADGLTTPDALLEVADAAASALANPRSKSVAEPLAAIERACDQIALAWSGSNIGYHATVYFAGLQPKPAAALFSPEWGLETRWPIYEPHRGWSNHDGQHVTDEILRRAGNPKTDELDTVLEAGRNTFGKLRESALSLVTATSSDRKDTFLDCKLGEIEQLKAPDPASIGLSLLPGHYWSRDSLAMSQGLTLAPHQLLLALPLSAAALVRAFDHLEQSTRASASHLRRLEKRVKKAGLVGTNAFIGHGRSPIWRELKDFIEDRLGLPVDEFNSARRRNPHHGPAIGDARCGDEHADDRLHARQNVVHEVGLFQGRLGFTRAIVLLEEGCEEFSNIHGLGQVRFPAGNISAKFEDVRAIFEREGLLTPTDGS